jgi:hypothetical protein
MSSQMKEPRRSERGREKEMNKIPQNPSAQQLLSQIRRCIIEHRESQYLTFENVEPEAGSLIVDSLNEDGEVERLRPRYYLSFHCRSPDSSLTFFCHFTDTSTMASVRVRARASQKYVISNT